MEADVETVIKLMALKFPSAADFNVNGDIVDILDKDDNIIGTITSDELTDYWNEAEEFEAIKAIDEAEYMRDVQSETGLPVHHG